MISTPTIDELKIEENERSDMFVNEVLHDFWICCVSRETSILGRREVLTGKAKFGILGDGKEVPQVAMAKAIKRGDWRSGYYRDQTLMFALGLCTVEQFFAQLYADTQNDPFSKGRQMNSHFATATIDANDEWLPHTELFNISADISCTGGQMARALGLAFASRKYREIEGLDELTGLSDNGNEVCFATIGDASTSEGVFWETVNAACVHKVPIAIAVWDDGYGISVPKELQTTKSSISKALEGFLVNEDGDGMDIYVAKAWDYAGLCELFNRGVDKIRKTHRPALFHIEECTQPQGHSTSGSHERYKSQERLDWERRADGIERMAGWMVEAGIASSMQVSEIRAEAKKYVRDCKRRAWDAFNNPVKNSMHELQAIYNLAAKDSSLAERISLSSRELDELVDPLISQVVQNARRLSYLLAGEESGPRQLLLDFIDKWMCEAEVRYHTDLYSDTKYSALKIPVVPASFSEASPLVNGYQVLNKYFDQLFERDSRVVAFGEDVGQIGDVNQGFAGLQEKYGKGRIFDTGIREWTIMGQAIGAAMRGLKPIAEIQYLDYLIYGLQPLTDDLATLRYRSGGLQMAPAIIRTRGHRLEGIWHAGSPMGLLVHALRGMYVCVPRNMTQAAGMYNTMIQSSDPGLVVECLNGYRLKERLPDNLSEFTVPLGSPEVLVQGSDITLVTYGTCVRVAQKAMVLCDEFDISVELVDVQTLLPFDLESVILQSLKKTNRLVVLDEDVPGGANAYILREILEVQGGYRYLDSEPRTITAREHRPPFGSDGDYFSKPNPEDVFEGIYGLMREAQTTVYPSLK